MAIEPTGSLRLGDETTQVEIDTVSGGRIAQIRFQGIELLVGQGSARPLGDPMRWGCYPMLPWAGRVRDGRFELDGHSYQLPVSADGHAIHGVGFTSAWTVATHVERAVELSLDLPADETWPFGGRARQQIFVGDGEIRMELEVTADDRRFPAVIGWHPWFRKPDRLQFHPTAMYRRVDGIAVDEQIDVRSGPWDDCFVNTEPIIAGIDGVDVAMTSDCTDWVVYDQPAHATCIEPQSGPPDAFNIRPHLLDPGHTLSRTFRIALTR